MGLRREDRVAVRLPIRVWGLDADGKPFNQPAETQDVTRSGACVTGLRTRINSGEVVAVQHGDLKSRFKVMWIGEPATPRQGQVGIRTMEPEKYIWGLALTKVQPQAPQTKENERGRRLHDRHKVSGAASMMMPGGSTVWGTIEDVSLAGCYIKTYQPQQKTTKLHMELKIENSIVHCEAEVRAMHPGVGMGVLFTQMSPEDHTRLEQLIDKLEGGRKAAETAHKKKIGEAGELRSKIAANVQAADHELHELLEALPAAKLDARVESAVRHAIQHCRAAILTAQRWADLQAQGLDGYRVLQQVVDERTRVATVMNRELVSDVDGCELVDDSEGVHPLFEQVERLYKRLALLLDVAEKPPVRKAAAGGEN
jgi:hypothetical protein